MRCVCVYLLQLYAASSGHVSIASRVTVPRVAPDVIKTKIKHYSQTTQQKVKEVIAALICKSKIQLVKYELTC